MSGILLNIAPVGNLFERYVTSIDKEKRCVYFDANGFVGAQDSL
ncbi:phosphoribosylformyl-glycineamide synthetase [Kluyvera ascorbata]|uniref:Phosphoribosylformyl-glycineamide synthetase n=1 Tax=Kluyvera ascorbata TaxID=51288 RepID=A0A3N2SDW1_9ENTR|nr:phosphoribosylformyl-glycineamide synthetase [Kluyvera ascorbata]